jgi:magnesium-transporting ATPase (P-type)
MVPVSINELLLRGCTLKNSGYILGLVIYTGAETRIQMNSTAPPRKQGAQQRRRACHVTSRATVHNLPGWLI